MSITMLRSWVPLVLVAIVFDNLENYTGLVRKLTIDKSLYEAAAIDGAGKLQSFFYVTLPQLRFIMLVMLLLQITATMQVFIEPFQLTGFTNPDTITVMTLIYRYAFAVNQDFGLAAALSVLLFVVLSAFAALYLRITRERTV